MTKREEIMTFNFSLFQILLEIPVIKKSPVIPDLIWDPVINKELNVLKGAIHDIC
jgi:hypothetical protein